jgi:hypothetical protein
LIDYYTTALVTGRTIDMGTALRIAKARYYNSTPTLTGYDEKVLQQLTFYGLPMQKVETGATLGNEDGWEEFTSVDFDLGRGSFPGSDASVKPLRVNFHLEDWPAATPIDGVGSYYTIEGRSSTVAGEAIQPLHFGNVSDQEQEARSAVMLTATYRIAPTFTPVYAVPFNEYSTENSTVVPGQQGDRAASPLQLRTRGNSAYVTTAAGAYEQRTGQQYLYGALSAQIYYSNSTDKTAPTLSIVDGIYEAASGQIQVKVGAGDPTGISAVFVNYITDRRQTEGTINVVKLTWDPQSQKWLGSFPGTAHTAFIAQVIDNAGNMAEASDKGQFYQVAVATDRAGSTPIAQQLFLPLIWR